MDNIIKFSFASLMILLTLLVMFSNYHYDKVEQKLKHSGNFAAKAAVLQEDDIQRSYGKIIIPDDIAKNVAEEYLKLNLNLDDDLNPKPGSLLVGPLEIEHFEVIDEADYDFSTHYRYINTNYKLDKELSGPFVVLVLKTLRPKISAFDPNEGYITTPIVFQYPFPELSN